MNRFERYRLRGWLDTSYFIPCLVESSGNKVVFYSSPVRLARVWPMSSEAARKVNNKKE